MGTKTPQALFNAVFYYNGKNLCLRGGETSTQLSQFTDHYVYNETYTMTIVPRIVVARSNKFVPFYYTCTVGL